MLVKAKSATKPMTEQRQLLNNVEMKLTVIYSVKIIINGVGFE